MFDIITFIKKFFKCFYGKITNDNESCPWDEHAENFEDRIG